MAKKVAVQDRSLVKAILLIVTLNLRHNLQSHITFDNICICILTQGHLHHRLKLKV